MVGTTLVALLVALPAAAAVSLTGIPNTVDTSGEDPVVLVGTFALGAAGVGPDVPLPPGVPVVWIDPAPLETGATVADAALHFELYFLSHAGSVKVEYGAFDPSDKLSPFQAFTPAGNPFSIGTASTTTAAGAPLDIGFAQGDIPGMQGTFDAGNHVAVRLTAMGAPNTLLTNGASASTLGVTEDSTATVPLPELPAPVLFGVGTVGVLGLVVLRRRAGLA